MFTIEWSDIAAMELAAQMRTATPRLRDNISVAIRQMDIEFAKEPDRLGESRPRGMRVVVIGPFVLWFSVNIRLKKVFILRIRVPPSER